MGVGLDMAQKLGTFPCISSKCDSEWGGQINSSHYFHCPVPVILIPTESQLIYLGILGSGEPAARGQAGNSDSGDGWMDGWIPNIVLCGYSNVINHPSN